MTAIAVVLTEDYADWESALVAATLRSYYGVAVLTASPDGNPVTSAGGFRVAPDMALADIVAKDIDMLIVNGGTAWASGSVPGLADLMRDMHREGKPVAAICDAVRALGEAGLLDDTPHTGNSAEELADVSGYHGGAHFVAQPAALSRDGIITAPGTAPVSFMRAILIELGFGGPELDYYIGMFGAEHAA
jgi:putative intracellular protease/amidase